MERILDREAYLQLKYQLTALALQVEQAQHAITRAQAERDRALVVLELPTGQAAGSILFDDRTNTVTVKE